MLRHVVLVCMVVVVGHHDRVAAKQQVKVSDSYLPVTMQIIAHLTDQMAFEVKDDIPPPRPTKTSTPRPSYVTMPSGGWWMYYSGRSMLELVYGV